MQEKDCHPVFGHGLIIRRRIGKNRVKKLAVSSPQFYNSVLVLSRISTGFYIS